MNHGEIQAVRLDGSWPPKKNVEEHKRLTFLMFLNSSVVNISSPSHTQPGQLLTLPVQLLYYKRVVFYSVHFMYLQK